MAEVNDAYVAALERYVEVGGEGELEAAYALGRRAVVGGETILGFLHQHQAAVDVLARRTDVPLTPTRVEATFQFLSEALATFEMAQSGYWEAQAQARRDRATALMLQHDLLPSAPSVADLDVAFRYLPGEATSHVGGDWYDLFELDDGRVGLVIGDVTGHGVSAAAAMGQLRMAVLAYALAGFEPGDVLRRIDVLLETLASGAIATMAYVIADPRHDQLLVANAGHPPPIVIGPDGVARCVDAGHGLLLGVGLAPERPEAAPTPITPGSQLLLYTDGLTEPLERDGRDGIAQLCEAAQGFTGTADDLCEHVLAELTPARSGDDICILAATFAA